MPPTWTTIFAALTILFAGGNFIALVLARAAARGDRMTDEQRNS